MDEKFSQHGTSEQPPSEKMEKPSRPAQRFRPLLAVAFVCLCVYVFIRPIASFGALPVTSLHPSLQAPLAVSEHAPIPLEAHIMSKCPDARDCLKNLILPTMMRASDKVNFTLSFIGTPTENDGVACKHGPEECELVFSLTGVHEPWGLNMHRDLEQAWETLCCFAPLRYTLTPRRTSGSRCV